MPGRPTLTAQLQELLIDAQIECATGQYDDVPQLAKQAAAIVSQLDTDVMDAVHRIKYGKDRRQW